MERLTTKINKEKALTQIAVTKGQHISQALKNAGLGRTQFYHWLKTDEDFKAKFIKVYQNIRMYDMAKEIKAAKQKGIGDLKGTQTPNPKSSKIESHNVEDNSEDDIFWKEMESQWQKQKNKSK